VRVFYGPGLKLWADATIRDLSTGGAKLQISDIYQLPSFFTVLNLADGSAYDVSLRWQRSELSGVSFLARHDMNSDDHPKGDHIREVWRSFSGQPRA
jgi:hypothetical protein